MKNIHATLWAILALIFLAAGTLAVTQQETDKKARWQATGTADHATDFINILPPGGTGVADLGGITVNGKELKAWQYEVVELPGKIEVTFITPLKEGDKVEAHGTGPMSGKGTIDFF